MSKVWMITGASRGLGKEFVREAVEQGDQVIATVRTIPDDELFKNENVLPVVMDVRDPEAIRKAVKDGVDRFGRIDVLVNNAGHGMNGAFEEISDEELREMMDTNYFGVANVIREVLPVMRPQQSGKILNVSSLAGAIGSLGSTSYCSPKFAVVGLSLSLAKELEEMGIQVAAVLPGAFRTDFRDASSYRYPASPMSEYDGNSVRHQQKFMEENNHKQMGDPAKAASFLYEIVDQETLPSRILIGEDCINAVEKDLENQLKEIAAYKEKSSKTAITE